MIYQKVIRSFSSLSLKWWWSCWDQLSENESQLKLEEHILAYMLTLFPNVCLSNVEGAPFMCLTSISIYIDYWKSFMKFGAKKSYEMISYIFAEITSFSKWKHGMSTKPFNLAKTTLIQLMNKSHEGFVLSKCQKMLLSVGMAKIVFFMVWFWPMLTNYLECLHGVGP